MNDEERAFIAQIAVDLKVTQARSSVMSAVLKYLIKDAPTDFLKRQKSILELGAKEESPAEEDPFSNTFNRARLEAMKEWEDLISEILDSRT